MYKYQVSSNTRITPTIRSITLVRKNLHGRPLLYQPGQYAAISLHDGLRPTTTRCFSLASSPTEGDFLQFTIRVNGKYTSALERLEKGDDVVVRGPFGSFVFNEHIHKDVAFFAGGIGIAPFLSMLRYASSIKTNNKIHLIYSCRSEEDVPFPDELRALQKKHPNIHVTYIVTDSEINVLRGLHVVGGSLDSASIEKLGLDYSTQTFMICGPPLYMLAVTKLLKERGVPDTKILTEAFSQGAHNQTDRLIHWPFNAYALSGLLFLVAGGLIVGADINKTLPKLEAKNITTRSDINNVIEVTDGTILAKINTIPPQVDTDITQEPQITYIPNPNTVEVLVPSTAPPVVTPAPKPASKPAPTPAKKPTPKPTPTPTVVPKSPPKSTAS